MPSPSLRTFNPTHFFHPLLRATHSIESKEDFFFFHTNLSVGLTQRVALKKRTMHLTERVGVTELVDVPLNGSIPFVVLEGESRQSPVSDG